MKSVRIALLLLSFFPFFADAQNVGIGTTTPGSKLTINGSLGVHYFFAPSDRDVILTSNNYYVVWRGDNTYTITLPAPEAGLNRGRLYCIKNASPRYRVTVAASGTERIDVAGGPGYEVNSISLMPGENVSLISTGNIDPNGISWEVIHHNITVSPNSTFWKLGGNNGTNPGSYFLGTSDAQDLSIRTNGAERIRITSGGNVGIGTVSPIHRLQVVDAATAIDTALFSSIQSSLGTGRKTYVKLGRSADITSTNSANIGFHYNNNNSRQNYLGFGFQDPKIDSNNRMVIRADGRVGIGTTTPISSLNVQGTFTDPLNDGLTITNFKTDVIPNQHITLAINTGMRGNLVGIGFGIPLHHTGFAIYDIIGVNYQIFGDHVLPNGPNLYDLGEQYNQWRNIYLQNSPIVSSDMRLKKDIQPVSYGIKEIMQMKPVSYRWKQETDNNHLMLGFLAQDMEKIVPEVVSKTSGDSGSYSMRYTELIPVLTKAIQEQQTQIEELKKDKESQSAKTTQLEQMLNHQQAAYIELQQQIKELQQKFQTSAKQ